MDFIHDGQVEMSVYYTDVDAGFEVVATYVTQDDLENPSHVKMVLDRRTMA